MLLFQTGQTIYKVSFLLLYKSLNHSLEFGLFVVVLWIVAFFSKANRKYNSQTG